MDKEFVISYLKTRNYWWQTREVSPADKGIVRHEYLDKIRAIEKLERIVCLSGIRRSGKTTILYQYIDHLLKNADAEPQKVVYVKVDDLLGKINSIHDVLNIYHELTGINPVEENVCILLDEIHVQKEWQRQLKYYLDAHAKCRFVVSGSSKTLLYKDASESLAGRIRFIDVFPLTFKEFLLFNGITLPEETTQVGIDNFKQIERAYFAVIAQKEQLLYLLNQYFDTGGYPEWFKIKDMGQWRRVLVDDYFSLILFRDIVSVFRVKDPLLLEKLVRDIAVFSTNRFSYRGLSERLGVDRETLKLYLYYLRSSMLISIADVYTYAKKAVEKREKKLFFCEEGLRRALTLDRDEGKSAENVVAWHLTKRGYCSKVFFVPYYWKNKYEVDFIYDDSVLVLPVEVKYREHPVAADTRGLIEFMHAFNVNLGIIVTKDVLKLDIIAAGKEIIFIPLWLFLLLL